MRKLYLLFIFLLPLFCVESYAGKEFEVSREFTLFTSENLSGYLKPLFTTIGESFNTGLHSSPTYKKGWSFGLDIQAMGMIIPNSHKTYSAVLPDKYGDETVVKTALLENGVIKENLSGTILQPTLYGGYSTPVFAAPQNHFPPDSFYKSLAFAEGNRIDFMSGLPMIKLFLGMPTRTQVKFSWLGLPVQGSRFTYYSIVLNQNIDKYFDLFEDKTFDLGVGFAYHSLYRNPGIDISSFAINLQFSKTYESGFSLFAGAQYENFGGTIRAVRDSYNPDDIVNSPYSEIRNGDPVVIDVSSYANYRFTGGISYKIGILELNASAAMASQPVLNAGLSLAFFDWEYDEEPEIIIPVPASEPIEEPEPIIAEIPVETKLEMILEEPEVVVPELKEKKLEADIEAYGVVKGVEKKLVTLNMEEKVSRHIAPLLPYIFFDDNSDEIPPRYTLLSNSDTKEFSLRKNFADKTLDNYYHVLNIIGTRMKANPKANITLTGCNSDYGKEKNNKDLSKRRIDKVKSYLTDVWEIDGKRINTQIRNLPLVKSSSIEEDGRSENRRVEIYSADPVITAPSVFQDTARLVLPPLIRFKPKVIAEAGLSEWRMAAESNSKLLKTASGFDLLPSIDWKINSEETVKALIKDTLFYYLEAKDNLNKKTQSVKKNIPVIVKKLNSSLSEKGDTVINTYDLILFDFNKSTIDGRNKAIIDLIKKESPKDAVVTVIGYTDRMGSEAHNMKLSTDRAASASKALNRPDAVSSGVGEEDLLYDNDLPEGRFYSRTVVVEVKYVPNK